MRKLANEAELISLMSHTIGSIGQVVKDASTLRQHYDKMDAFEEVKRIYDGYVIAISKITGQ